MKDEWKGWNSVFFPSSRPTSSSLPAGSVLHSCLCWMCSQEALDQAGTCAHCQVEAEEVALCLPHAQKLLLLQMRNHLCKQASRPTLLYRKHACWKGHSGNLEHFHMFSRGASPEVVKVKWGRSFSFLLFPSVVIGDSNRLVSGSGARTYLLGSSVGPLFPLWHHLGLIQKLQVKFLLQKSQWWTFSLVTDKKLK